MSIIVMMGFIIDGLFIKKYLVYQTNLNELTIILISMNNQFIFIVGLLVLSAACAESPIILISSHKYSFCY